MYPVGEPECDAIVEGAVRFLLDGNEVQAAQLLVNARLSAWFYHDPGSEPRAVYEYNVTLFVGRETFDALTNDYHRHRDTLLKALTAQVQAFELESVQYDPAPDKTPRRPALLAEIERRLGQLPGGLPSGSQLLASAVRFLIDGGEEDIASFLLSAKLAVWESGDTGYDGDETIHAVHLELEVPRPVYDAMESRSTPGQAVRKAIDAVLPSQFYVKHFNVKGVLVDLDPDWQAELLEIARGQGVHNQGHGTRAARTWNNLNFRSESEIRVARALDGAGVLFVPNCLVRVNSPAGRVNREPDFLVCADGKWGILEVDGEPFHPPSRTAADHERDRLFKGHGVRVVEHFDATECYNRAGEVVAKFLAILRSA
ncbi:MAG: hypothetical protein HYX53_01825 [Chloroflexi bacterium]|nr:hypothetical protein [Chloroflexota bacterium]